MGGDAGTVGAEGQPGRETNRALGWAKAPEHQYLVAAPGVVEVDAAVVAQRRQPLPIPCESDATDGDGTRFADERARHDVPDVDFLRACRRIRDPNPGPVRVEREELHEARAIERPEHGQRLCIPDGDRARSPLAAAARRELAAVAAPGEGIDRVHPRLEGRDRLAGGHVPDGHDRPPLSHAHSCGREALAVGARAQRP